MTTARHKLLLADDDTDDCIFFKEALDELSLPTLLTTVNDGVELIDLLTARLNDLPDVIFLDLNMSKKSGFECLSEIKSMEEMKALPIIIFSTSLDMLVVNQLYDMGAHYYIRKPSEFSQLKKVIEEAIKLIADSLALPARDKFIIQP